MFSRGALRDLSQNTALLWGENGAALFLLSNMEYTLGAAWGGGWHLTSEELPRQRS